MEIDERKEDVVEVFTEYLVNNGLKKSQERVSVVKSPRLHINFNKTYNYGICASCARKEKSKLRKIQNKNKK